MAGGFYLAYEGVEKIIEFLFHRKKEGHEVIAEQPIEDGSAEKAKIKSAITTDFILSVEIVIIALSTVETAPLTTKILTVSVVAILATIGVYGVVALIVRMDDAGYKLLKISNEKGFLSLVGKGLVKGLPIIIRILAVLGTIALLLVSGGIFEHSIDYLHHLFPTVPASVKNFAYGIIAGLIAVCVMSIFKKILPKKTV